MDKTMKTTKIFGLLLGIFVATVAFGQTEEVRPLTKKERKEWKKRKKAMSPADFRLLYEQNTEMKASNASLEGELRSLESQVSTRDEQIIELQKQVKRMQAAYQASQRELENVKDQQSKVQAVALPQNNVTLVNGEDFSVGVVFKVQVGAFRKVDLEKYSDTSKEFDQEEMEGLRKYVIGNFRNYEDANVLKRYLREMGVKDAWIVPYKDNKRVPLKEVIDQASN